MPESPEESQRRVLQDLVGSGAADFPMEVQMASMESAGGRSAETAARLGMTDLSPEEARERVLAEFADTPQNRLMNFLVNCHRKATQEEATKLRCPMNTGACPVRQRTSALEEVAQASLELRRSWAASSRRGTGVGWERWLNALATLERLTDPEAAP